MRATDDAELITEVEAYLAVRNERPLSSVQRAQMSDAMPGLKERAKTIPQLLEMANFLRQSRPIVPDEAAAKLLTSAAGGVLTRLTSRLQHASWNASDLEVAVRAFAAEETLGLGKVAQPVRVALSGRTISPSIFDMMEILGRDESLARISDCATAVETTS
jgi:glutamyl-tRNA synthetase